MSLVGSIFAHASFLLPLPRLRETGTLIAVRHPRPCYPVHILLIPKKDLADLAALGPEDAPFLVDLVQAAASLASELGLEATGYRLIANGGPNQSIPLLHFHLISDTVPERSSISQA